MDQDLAQDNTTADTKRVSLDDPFTDPPKRPVYVLQHHPSQKRLSSDPDLKLNSISHTRHHINPINPPIPGHEGAGMGRIVRFAEPQPLHSLIERTARGVGNPKGFPIAIPQGKSIEEIQIRSVGICAGSGGSLLQGLDVDLLFTGELGHHDALAAIEAGRCIVTLFHSNTERGFLHVLRERLETTLREQWEELRSELKGFLALPDGVVVEDMQEALDDESVVVDCSERDRDPYGVVIRKGEV